MARESLGGQLDLLLLSALRAEPAHGYAVIEEIRRRSEDAFDLPESSVYPALHRLEQSGLLESEWAEVSGRRRLSRSSWNFDGGPGVMVMRGRA